MRLVLAALLLTALPAMAQDEDDGDYDPARRDELISVIEENGCKMTEEEAGTILPGLDFTMEESRAIVAALVDEGLAVNENGTLVLQTENCP